MFYYFFRNLRSEDPTLGFLGKVFLIMGDISLLLWILFALLSPF